MIDKILRGRYKIQRQLRQHAGRQTLLARDLTTDELVIIKLLTFGSDFEWQDFKLFTREAQILQELSHPAIPRYLDYFELDLPLRGFALVQTYIPAKSLEEYLQAGRTFSEEEVRQIAKALLEVLIYLHERLPPVIHRDLKASNVLLGDRLSDRVGRVYLSVSGRFWLGQNSHGATRWKYNRGRNLWLYASRTIRWTSRSCLRPL